MNRPLVFKYLYLTSSNMIPISNRSDSGTEFNMKMISSLRMEECGPNTYICS